MVWSQIKNYEILISNGLIHCFMYLNNKIKNNNGIFWFFQSLLKTVFNKPHVEPPHTLLAYLF